MEQLTFFTTTNVGRGLVTAGKVGEVGLLGVFAVSEGSRIYKSDNKIETTGEVLGETARLTSSFLLDIKKVYLLERKL